MLNLKWNKYIPHDPTPKQAAFLSLPYQKLLYGGAAGGGKSDALLACALQYVDVKGYSGIIFRKKLTDHKLPGSILNRALDWLSPYLKSKEVRYKPGEHTFYFPSGATLVFGYMDTQTDRYRYQSSEYQTVCYDEATQFNEADLTYLFSRLRRTMEQKKLGIPLRYRLATNPGGIGHNYIKKEFDIRVCPELGKFKGFNRNAPFIPAYIIDNPFLDQEYMEMLENLPKVERDRLLEGNWDSQEASRFSPGWFTDRWFREGDKIILNGSDGRRTYKKDDLLIFGCIDPAASVKTGIEGAVFTDRKQPSWSVISTFGMTLDGSYDLIWLNTFREQCNIPSLQERTKILFRKWKHEFFRVESNGIGMGVYQNLQSAGIPIKPITASNDKVINSSTAQLRAEGGKIWLPEYEYWLSDLQDELFIWTGNRNETDDQIDVLSSGANEVAERALGNENDYTLPNFRVNADIHYGCPSSVGGATFF